MVPNPLTHCGCNRWLVIAAWSLVIQPEERLVKSNRAARICPIGPVAKNHSAKKKEVSCSPQQEASRFWLFQARCYTRPKTHSRTVDIGDRSVLALRGPQLPNDSTQITG